MAGARLSLTNPGLPAIKMPRPQPWPRRFGKFGLVDYLELSNANFQSRTSGSETSPPSGSCPLCAAAASTSSAAAKPSRCSASSN